MKITEDKKKINILGWGITFLLLINLIVMSLIFFKLKPNAQNIEENKIEFNNNPLTVETMTIESVNSYQVSRNYTGTIASRRNTKVSFEHSGEVVQIFVREGQTISKGTPLAILNNSSLKIKQQELLAIRIQAVAKLQEMEAGVRIETIEAAKAQVKIQEASLEHSKTRSIRRQQLFEQGGISREDLDEAIAFTKISQARLDEANSKLDELLAGTRNEQILAQQAIIAQHDAQLANLEIELNKGILKAPFNGTIDTRLVDEGTVVNAGQPVLEILENQALEAHIGVPPEVASKLTIGSEHIITIGEDNYTGVISSILPKIDPQTQTVTVILQLLTNNTNTIISGQIVRLNLNQNINSLGYWLPTQALIKGDKGLWSCYVLGEEKSLDNKSVFILESRDIEILHTQGDRVFVRGTIQDNDKVVISGTHRLVLGQSAISINSE